MRQDYGKMQSLFYLKARKAPCHLAVRKLPIGEAKIISNTGDTEAQAKLSVSIHHDKSYCRMYTTARSKPKISPV